MLSDHGDYPSDTVAGLEANAVWDGVFHLASWVAVTAGVWILWRRATTWRQAASGRALFGWPSSGGRFNLVEGIVDHHVLGPPPRPGRRGQPLPWDLGFLAFGALFLGVGPAPCPLLRRRCLPGRPTRPG